VARMEWICGQEGIQADAEVLAVLAQAGEGSVRDSLSALDQAIACCGNELKAEEVRALLGAFSIDSLHQVTQALTESDSRRMLEIVADLERNGRNIQHFCRELAGYFRNLVVARIAGKDTRLIAASPAERARLAEIAASFTEEDLTRYLHLTLDLYGDLQRSTQPRLHMEIGLLRLVQAGKLLPIEEALAMLGGAPAASNPAPKQSPPAPPAPPASGWQAKLHAALLEIGNAALADAVAHSVVTETPGQLEFQTPKDFRVSMKEPAIRKALQHLGTAGMKISIAFVDSTTAAPAEQAPQGDSELTDRALSHPEVQRFRETLGGQVRAVRNLKE
jgi:DNA polymerase III subunit gamma/tau